MSAQPDYGVLVVGAGPTGLCVASELQRHGVNVGLLEHRSTPGSASRAIGVHSTTLEHLEASGATERILTHAVRITHGIARTKTRVLGQVCFERLRTRFPCVLTLPQKLTEEAVGYGGPDVTRGMLVTSIEEHEHGVCVTGSSLAGTFEFNARAVVIAAGAPGRELLPPGVRIRAHQYPDRYLMSDVVDAPSQPDAAVITLERDGVLESFPLPEGGRRLVAWDHAAAPRLQPADGRDRNEQAGGSPARARLQAAVVSRTGDEGLATSVHTTSSFGIRRVLVTRMRVGRIFMIGDTAHEVSPIGGQGMNLGLIDAATLAPVLAEWARGGIPAPDAIDRWERDRLASARTAARLAALNTLLGRPRSAVMQRARSGMLNIALAGPGGSLAARAYSMGLDRGAGVRWRGRR